MKTTGKAHTEMGVFTGDTWSSMSCYRYWNVGAQVDTVKDKFAQSDGVWGLNKFCIISKDRRSPKQFTRKNDTSFGFLDRHFSKTSKMARWVEALAGKPED